MAGTVTTNIVVQFGADTDDTLFLSAEIDSRPEGLNGGKTSFVPGEKAVFLIFSDPKIDTLDIVKSDGTLSDEGTGLFEVSEFITFANTTSTTLQKLPEGAVKFKKIGGTVPSTPAQSGVNVTIPDPKVGVYKATYQARYDARGITSPLEANGETSFPIVVVITGIDTGG